MFYPGIIQVRRPLVIASVEHLSDPHTLSRIQKATRAVLGWAVEAPQNQYAVTCEASRIRPKVGRMLLGTYYTEQQREENIARENRHLPHYHPTPEPGVTYRPSLEGASTGSVSTHATSYVNSLLEAGAIQLDGYALLTDTTYLETVLSPDRTPSLQNQ